MNIFKVLFSLMFLLMLVVNPKISFSDTGTGSKANELNKQIIDEIKEVLKTPYLKYESKNLTGFVKVETTVAKNGKIVFKDVKGINENLKSNVFDKLNSLNLWTSPDYEGKYFIYRLKYTD